MQDPQDSPRTTTSLAAVTGLLQNYQNVQIEYGARHLDENQNVVGDLSEFMSDGSSIQSDSTATIHRTCTLMMDSSNPVTYGQDFVQPYMTIIDPNTDDEATFYLGVYTLASPTFDNSNLPSVLTLTGYDLLFYINTVIGDSVQIATGTDPINACIELIGTAFPGAIISYTDTTSVLSAPVTFPFDDNTQSTYLDVVNALLQAAGYQPLWVDWNGVFQLQPYVTPSNQAIEWTFDLTSDTNIVAEQRTSEQDLFDVPNYWQFVMTNLATSPVEGATQFTYIDGNPNNPGSVGNRGGRQIKKILFVTAADYPSLVAYGLSVVTEDLNPAETFSVTTSPFPIAWQFDQIFMVDPNLANLPPANSQFRRIQAVTWNLPLDGQSDMTWDWQTVLT